MIPDCRDIAEYILNNYADKAVEIGVGNLPEVALLLRHKLDVVVTDIDEHEFDGIKYYRDDIFRPDMNIYLGSSLIYSIRPPLDLQDAIAAIAKEVGADLIIRPFGNEFADLGKYFKEYSLVNYKRARFFLYQPGKSR